jgi:hypothetical protein
VIVRRERAHPGAQMSFTDHDGHRFQAILTDQAGEIAEIERRHRARARVEDHIRNDKDTGMRNLPFKACLPTSIRRDRARAPALRLGRAQRRTAGEQVALALAGRE